MVTDQATYNRKKFRNQILIFIVKLAVYLSVVYINLTEQTWFKVHTTAASISNALSIFLGANLLISIGWIVMISWYLRKNRMQRLTRDNFVLGINRISSVLNTIFALIAIMVLFGVDIIN